MSPIFVNFIEEFRNNIVKEYRSPVRWVIRRTPEDSHLWTDYLITAGYYKDRDLRGLIQEAIDWWEEYITELETMTIG